MITFQGVIILFASVFVLTLCETQLSAEDRSLTVNNWLSRMLILFMVMSCITLGHIEAIFMSRFAIYNAMTVED